MAELVTGKFPKLQAKFHDRHHALDYSVCTYDKNVTRL